MTLSERLNAAKDDMLVVMEAFRTEDASAVSSTGDRLVAELVGLDDAAWDVLLADLRDDELRKQMESLRQLLKERGAATAQLMRHVRQVGHSASFNVSPPALTIDLNFTTTGGETLAASDDLEDTLWVGTAVVQAVCQTMRSMKETLNSPAQRACIGSSFERNLDDAEAAIAEIRQIYELVLGADTLD